jgi:hypothetical protein
MKVTAYITVGRAEPVPDVVIAAGGVILACGGFEADPVLAEAYLPRNPNRPRLPSWAVFDEEARRAGPLNGLLGTPNDYAWSPDNSAEIDRGWILAADGPSDLAARMAVDPGS